MKDIPPEKAREFLRDSYKWDFLEKMIETDPIAVVNSVKELGIETEGFYKVLWKNLDMDFKERAVREFVQAKEEEAPPPLDIDLFPKEVRGFMEMMFRVVRTLKD